MPKPNAIAPSDGLKRRKLQVRESIARLRQEERSTRVPELPENPTIEKQLEELVNALRIEEQPRAHAAFMLGEVREYSPDPPANEDEGSEADWLAVKDEVLKLLQMELLDSPESHLAYIRERLKPVFEHGAVES
jgi:hypothetical protein